MCIYISDKTFRDRYKKKYKYKKFSEVVISEKGMLYGDKDIDP